MTTLVVDARVTPRFITFFCRADYCYEYLFIYIYIYILNIQNLLLFVYSSAMSNHGTFFRSVAFLIIISLPFIQTS